MIDDLISFPDFFKFKQALRVGMHEFTHALGFSSGLFEQYLMDPATDTKWPATAFPKDSQGLNIGVATTRVLNWARNYFKCPTLGFMPLENDGGTGTAGSHWEQAAVYDEYMVGIATQFFPISNFTLNLLAGAYFHRRFATLTYFPQDSGWYLPDFSKAEDLSWGWAKGCQFLNTACTEPAWNSEGPTEAYDCRVCPLELLVLMSNVLYRGPLTLSGLRLGLHC